MLLEPKTISEEMMYSTIRLIANNGSVGTGFFFNFRFDDKIVPIIITNKHVINDNPSENITFFLHIKSGEYIDDESFQITFNTKWFFHDDKDLCFCFANPLFEQIKKQLNKLTFYKAITEDLIPDITKLRELSAIEDVIMVGYPIGLWDQKNNFPLFRRGITASHPAMNFNRENIGALDMACFPGSSGSPVFIINENGYSDRDGNTYIGRKRLIFLGILFEGPRFNARGELVIENIPTQQRVSSQTPLMVNLGYYIKSIEILRFKEIIKKIINQ